MRNVVFGVYRFLGFHLCNYLLESGQEVAGFDWKSEEDEVEEKREMFGRNANYSFYNESWEANEDIQLYISLYDYLDDPSFTSEQFRELIGYIECMTEKFPKNQTEIVIFLPEEVRDHLHCIMSEWKLKIEQEYVVRYLYISELYGPWNPPYKPIINIIEKNNSVLNPNMSKYIYIDDFFRSWKDIMAIQKKSIYVEGKQADHWERDLQAYANDQDLDFSEFVASKNVDFLIEANISLIEGIELIKEHNEKVAMLRKWNS